MSKKISTLLAIAVSAFAGAALLVPSGAVAQGNPVLTNLIPESESAQVRATITAINPATREVSLRGASGETVTMIAGPSIRLELLKVGDTVNARYYRSVAWGVVGASGGNGTPAESTDQITAMLSRPAQAPGGVAVQVVKISGTVVGIDLAAHRLQIISPGGGEIQTVDVTNATRQQMMSLLKVGDTVTAVVSEALAITIQPAAKGM